MSKYYVQQELLYHFIHASPHHSHKPCVTTTTPLSSLPLLIHFRASSYEKFNYRLWLTAMCCETSQHSNYICIAPLGDVTVPPAKSPGFDLGLFAFDEDNWEVNPWKQIMIVIWWNYVSNSMSLVRITLFYLYFPPSFHLIYVCFCPVGLSLL